jgi:hypothetical protein
MSDQQQTTEEILAEVQDFAYRYMLKNEIAIITGVAIERLSDQEDPAGIAFLKGRYMRKAELNGSVIQLTKQLSSPAMAIEHKIAESTYLNDLKKR